MSISRTFPLGLADPYIVQTNEINQMDQKIASAVDKRAGQTDTVQSNLTFDAATTTTVNGTLNVNGATALGNTTIPSGAQLTIAGGGNLRVQGTMTVPAAGSLNVQQSATFITSADLQLNNNKNITYPTPRAWSRWVPAQTNFGVQPSGGWAPRFTGASCFGVYSTSGSAGAGLPILVTGLRDGATVTSIDMVYRLASGTRNPSQRLGFTFLQSIGGTETVSSMFSASGNTVIQVPAYTSYNTTLTTTITADQNNVIDGASTQYWLYIADEYGTSGTYQTGDIVYGFRINGTVTKAPVA